MMNTKTDPLIGKLIEKLGDSRPSVRRNAAGALRLHGRRAASAVPMLRSLLDDPDPVVRREAERALENLRRPAA
ncbi:MAG: HEAT repeat domain-containing protein [Pirellulales bacterium]